MRRMTKRGMAERMPWKRMRREVKKNKRTCINVQQARVIKSAHRNVLAREVNVLRM